MGRIRALLLMVIGVLSGAALGMDAAKRGVQRVAEDFERSRLRDKSPKPVTAAEPFPAIGRKGGTSLLEAQRSTAPPQRVGSDRSADNFGTAPNRRSTGGGAATEPSVDNESPSPTETGNAGGVYTGTYRHDITLEHVHSPWGYLRELFSRFTGDFCPAWAASLSFFSILSIAPILLCGLAVLGYVIHDPVQATGEVQHMLARLLPGTGATTQRQAADLIQQFNVEKSVETLYAQRGVAAVIGVLSLFWAALQIFVNATTPMNAAFRTRETRGWIKLRLVALCLLLGAGVLFLGALAPSYIAQHLTVPNLGGATKPVIAFLLTLAGVAINAVMFAVIYRYLPSPSAQMTWKAAWLGGGVVAVLWEIAKEAFAYYLTRFAHYDKVYGSLGTLIGLLFWIYYTSMILLLGAEIAKLYLDAQAAKQTVKQRG